MPRSRSLSSLSLSLSIFLLWHCCDAFRQFLDCVASRHQPSNGAKAHRAMQPPMCRCHIPIQCTPAAAASSSPAHIYPYPYSSLPLPLYVSAAFWPHFGRQLAGRIAESLLQLHLIPCSCKSVEQGVLAGKLLKGTPYTARVDRMQSARSGISSVQFPKSMKLLCRQMRQKVLSRGCRQSYYMCTNISIIYIYMYLLFMYTIYCV